MFLLIGPTGTPMNVTVRGLTRTSANISWQPPPVEKRRGFITQYTVVVRYEEKGEIKNKTYMVPEQYVIITGIRFPRIVMRGERLCLNLCRVSVSN